MNNKSDPSEFPRAGAAASPSSHFPIESADSARIQIFPWSSLLHTGIETIDEQHHTLVQLLNELAGQFVDGEDEDTVLRVIDALAEYAIYHFETEEKIWRAELPAEDYERHEASHADFKQQIDAFRARVEDPSQIAENLLSYLTEWLAFHILESDRHMAWKVLALRQGMDYAAAREQAEHKQRSDDGRLSRVIMTLYRRMATTTLALMRSQEAGARERTQSYDIERAALQEDLLRAQEMGRIGNWKLDIATGMLTWSRQTYRLFELPEGTEVTLEDFLGNVHEEDREYVAAAWNAALQSGQYDITHRTVQSDGKRWLREIAEFGGWQDGVATLAFGVAQDVTESKFYQRQLEDLAFKNPLTGLPNRYSTLKWINHEVPGIIASNSKVCLFQIDIDSLQQINLSLGDEAGDDALRAIAKRLQQEAKASFVGHLGSDIFVLAYSGCKGENCQSERAAKLMSLMGMPISLGGLQVLMSACIGSVKFEGKMPASAEALLRVSALALYRAKTRGRNSSEHMDFSEHESAIEKQEKIRAIEAGLSRGEFVLFYQPKIDLMDGSLFGVEALIRWQHPELGLTGPAGFIPDLEHEALLITLGDWVINEALAQRSAWYQAGLQTTVSVNVATRQLVHPLFVEKLIASLAQHPEGQPFSFELEFLETGELVDLAVIREVFEKVRALNINTSLDDFGTGISSLRVLSDLKMPIIKIDRSFVVGMLERQEDMAIVRSALALGQALGCVVIAEGVETEIQLEKLRELGCRYIQGYVAARPMPAAELPAWLAQWLRNPPSWCSRQKLGDTHNLTT